MNTDESRGDATLRRAQNRFRAMVTVTSILVITVGVTICVTAFGSGFKEASQQQAAIEEIRGLGGIVYTDGNVVDRWLWNPVITYVDLSNTDVSDSDLAILKRFPPFTHLYLSNTRISDSSIAELTSLKSLEVLKITNTGITKEGTERIQHALPNCKVEI
jgi:hypothetical protein